MKKISILIPVYNEIKTIETILDKVHAAPIPKGFNYEIVCVDDASSDGTVDWLKKYKNDKVSIYFKEKNAGKGAAIKDAIAYATGDIMIIQDADLEYDPNEYSRLLDPIINGHADVVYGSRLMGGSGPQRVLFYWHSVGNRFLTTLSNMFTNINLTDMETCYKVFTKDAIAGINIKSKRFGLEPEITSKFAKKKLRMYEIPISYYGRDYSEGKKIGWKDGVSAIWCIIRFNLFPR